MSVPHKRRSRPSTASGSTSKELVLYKNKNSSKASQSRPSTAPGSSIRQPVLCQKKNALQKRCTSPSAASCSSSTELFVYHGQGADLEIHVPGLQPRSVTEEQELLQEVYALLDPDSQANVELNRKIDLLKRRYQHAVKSELVNFCYASSLGSFDTEESVSSIAAPRSQDFVSTLMQIVEEDKQIGRIATNLVEDIESVEQGKERDFRPSSRNRRDNASAIVDMSSMVHKLQQSRDHVLQMLQEERKSIFANAELTSPKTIPLKLKLRIASPGGDHKDAVQTVHEETAKGILRILDRLGCKLQEDQSIHQMLSVAKERLATLKQDVTRLRELHSERSTTNSQFPVSVNRTSHLLAETETV